MKFALSRSLWHGRGSSGSASRAISIRRPTAAARSYSGGIVTPRASARARYASTIRSGTNSPGMAGPSWIRRSESATRRSVSGRWTASSLTGCADDEPGHEIALRPDERGHLRADADPGRGDRRRVLDLAADAEQVRVVAGQPDDPALVRAGRVDPEVAVRDPAGQRGQGQLATGQLGHLLHGPDEVVVQLSVRDRLVGQPIMPSPVTASASIVDRAAPDGDDVVDPADHEQQPDQRLEQRPGRQPFDGWPPIDEQPVDQRVPVGAALAPEVAEQLGRRPQRDVDEHDRAPDEGEDVDRHPPPPEAEPRRLVRPAAAARDQQADVAQEVAQVDQPGRRDRQGDAADRPDEQDRDRREDADRDRPHSPGCGSAR